MSEHLIDYSVVIELPIMWGHMDSFQHVNNIIFFRFFESVRIAYFERIGFLKSKEETGIGPILASTSCKYVAPLTYPDTVKVGTRTVKLSEYSFEMEYIIVSKQSNKIAAVGEAKAVSFDYNKQEKAPLPKNIKNKILELEENLKD